MYVDEIKLAGQKQNIDAMWNVLVKEVDLGEPTSFFDHVFFGCTQRECQTSKDTVDNHRDMFESKSLLELRKSYLILRNMAQSFLHGLMIRKVMQRNVWSDIAN